MLDFSPNYEQTTQKKKQNMAKIIHNDIVNRSKGGLNNPCTTNVTHPEAWYF